MLCVFTTALIVSNIIAVKLVDLGGLILPAAVILFPVAYIFGDILTEVYGYALARRAIWIGFGCNVLAVAAIWLAGNLNPAAFWDLGIYEGPADAGAAYQAVLGFAPRLLMASFAAYLVGEFLNAAVMSRMKVATGGRHLWARTIGSTVVGQAADSAIFITLAFGGIIPPLALAMAIGSQWLVKTAYEVIATPITYAIVNRLKRAEGLDPFDEAADLNPFKMGVAG